MRVREFYHVLKEEILKNKILMVCLSLVTAGAYGFAITHYSIGVDDPAAFRYVHSYGASSLVDQGRLLHLLLDKLTGYVEFTPFLGEFVAVLLFFASALLWCTLLAAVCQKKKASTAALTVFACLYISYPIINEKFIYHLDVIVTMLSYTLCVLSLWFCCELAFHRRWSCAAAAVLLQMGAIASYESFHAVFLCGTFLILILYYLGQAQPREKKLGFIVAKGLWFAGVFAVSFLAYRVLSGVARHLLNPQSTFVRDSIWNNGNGLLSNLRLCLKNIRYNLSNVEYLSVTIFLIACALALILGVVLALRHRSVTLLLLFAGLGISNFLLPIAAGMVLYRASLSFTLFCAFLFFLLMHSLEGHRGLIWCRRGVTALLILLIFLQTRDLNQWFYHDYVRFQKEEFAVRQIATQLQAQCDVTKPVVFTGKGPEYLRSQTSPSQVNGYSVVGWGIGTFSDPRSVELHHVFEMLGYDFVRMPTLEQALRGKELSRQMDAGWPQENSIQEFEDIIVVNFAAGTN